MTPVEGVAGAMRFALNGLPREALEGHDGRSGAQLERVRLRDGTRLIVKTASPTEDLGALVSGDTEGRELGLWRNGFLDGLPDGVGHAIVDGWREDDGRLVTVMRDLGGAVLTWRSRLTRQDCRRILESASVVHTHFAGTEPAGLCPLERYLVALSPAAASAVTGLSNPLPGLIVHGWELFADLVPSDVLDRIESAFADPTGLAEQLCAEGTTLLHGDLWPVNIALESHQVTLLDWGLATAGPPALDLAVFLVGAGAMASPSREQLISDFREGSGGTSDAVLRQALFAGLLLYGWNKALDAVEHPDPAVRILERADLDWWVARAREAVA